MKPLWITATSAKGNEKIQTLVLLDHLQKIQCKNAKEMTICEVDKVYDSDELRMQMLKRGYLPIIGYRKSRKARIRTKEIYTYFKAAKKRWVVEKSFSWLKKNVEDFWIALRKAARSLECICPIGINLYVAANLIFNLY